MRYKIKTQNDAAYRDVLSILQGQTKVFVTSPRRRMVSTGDLPGSLRTAVEARGGRIVADRQYDLEQVRQH
jgi:hypothetical protein